MISGVINVYKEAGYTSHDVAARLRGILHQKKIGHTGTLDPDAVGVLPVCLGRATKMADMLGAGTKTYETVLLLGRETDTQDTAGETICERPVCCTPEDVVQLIPQFLGEQAQIPPMYSAKKVQGKRLYQLAREGIVVERKPAQIRIEAIEVLDMALPRVRLRVTCSRGTYIRTLCHDIGQRLGCGGCMEYLVRTRVGCFRIDDSSKLEEIRQRAENGTLGEVLLPPDSFFSGLPAVYAGPAADRLLHNGNALPAALAARTEAGRGACRQGGRIRVYDADGVCTGIYAYCPKTQAFVPELFFYDG